MKQFNEKPSALPNLGQDVKGAKRHNFDTYENPERALERERVKRSKSTVKDLKSRAVEQLNESNFLEVVQSFEFAKALQAFPTYSGPTDLGSLKLHVMEQRGSNNYNILVGKYNRLVNLTRRLKWRIRSLEDARKHFETKQVSKFTETNGVNRPWKLETKFNHEVVLSVSANTRAVQFGNSIPENEREYCLENLNKALEILGKYYSFEFKALAFSFGARGKAGSIAHYQDAQKVLAFNRSWDGAFIHELGHAIDYSLGRISSEMPYSIRQAYREKLNTLKVQNQQYYRKPTEIFARLFEMYIRATVPECNDWMQSTFDAHVMPDLNAETLEYMSTCLKTLLRETK